MGQQTRVRQVVVPTESVSEIKDGKKIQVEKRTMPGYVLVNMEMTDDVWGLVKNTPGVTGFVGGQAIDYTLSRWEALGRYVADGQLEIDNNLCENSIRPTAIGKKNYLFIGHPEAGQRSAVIYSVLGSCRRHGVNPAEYLQDVFERLPKAKTSDVPALTPAAWAEAKRKAARQSN
jgi:hypothetical protein